MSRQTPGTRYHPGTRFHPGTRCHPGIGMWRWVNVQVRDLFLYSDEQIDPRYKVPSRYKDVEMGECTCERPISVQL